MRLLPAAVIAGLPFCILTGVMIQGQPVRKVSTTLHIGGEGGWDYVSVDPASHRLFVTRTTHTMIIDADSGKILGDIPDQKVAHGVAIAPRLNRGFITDGGVAEP